MAKTKTLYSRVIFAALLLGAVVAQAADNDTAKADIDPKADALFKKMSDFVGGMKSFSVDVDMIEEKILADNFKMAFYRQGGIKVLRPNKFALSRHGIVLNMDVLYNGKELVLSGKNIDAYVTIPVEGDIDAGLDAGAEATGGALPARDLLSSDSYTPMMEPVEKLVYVGKVPMGDVVCHQLAARTAEVDWQLWIQDGDTPLPCRYSITSKWLTAAPEFSVNFSNWQVDPKLPASDFDFTAPKGAKALTIDEFTAAVEAL